jgi:hypothetical protein
VNIQTHRRIELFLLAKLHGAGLKHFQERLAADSTLRREVHLEKMIIKNIQFLGREKWRKKFKIYEQEINGS